MAAPAKQQTKKPEKATQLTTQQIKMKDLAALIESRRGAFAAVAAKQFDVMRMIKLAQVAMSRTPQIADCSPESILAILIRCSELGLEPGALTGGMHLVPRNNRKSGRLELTGVIDYRAFINLGKRSGVVLAARARAVKEKDKFRHWEDETGIHFIWEPAFGERGKLRGFFAVAELAGEEEKIQFDYMTLAEVNAIKARANPQGLSPWLNEIDFEEMGKKTVLRRVMKLVPNAKEAQEAAALESKTEAVEPGDVDPALFQLPSATSGGTAEKVAAALGAGEKAPIPSEGEWKDELDQEGGEPGGTPPPKDEPGVDG